MSEERLERIENQLVQVIQAVGVMQQNMTVVIPEKEYTR